MLGFQTNKKWKRAIHVDDLFWLHILFMQVSGHWPIDYTKILPHPLAFASKYLNIMYMSFITFLNWHSAVLFIIKFSMDVNAADVSVTIISNDIFSIIMHCYSGFGGFYIQINRPTVERIMRMMNEQFHRRSARGLTYVTIEPSYLYSMEVTILWNVILVLGCGFLVMVPFLLNTEGKTLVFSTWYPYDEYAPVNYELTFFLQCWVQFAILFGFGNIGNMLISSAILVCGQYDILFCSLKNIRYTAMLLAGDDASKLKIFQHKLDPLREEINQYYYNYEQKENLDFVTLHDQRADYKPEPIATKPTDTYLMDYHRELNHCLKQCIFHHLLILDCCAEMETYFSPVIFIKSLQITSQICNLMYISTKTTAVFFVNMAKIDYLFLTLSELFIFGYAGNWLKLQSVRITDACLRCPWYLCGGPFRRNLIMLMANTLRPVVLTGGRFFVLDYDKAKAIITAAFSYFTLLQKLENKAAL